MSTIPINIDAKVFKRLQSYAEPLIDDIDSVLRRLCDYWDQGNASGAAEAWARPSEQPRNGKHFVTLRGVCLPVPLAIYGEYRGKRIYGQVTASGIRVNGLGMDISFQTPSQAAIAVKRVLGAKDTAASTNGWLFWMTDEAADALGTPVPLDHFRQAAQVATDEGGNQDGS